MKRFSYAVVPLATLIAACQIPPKRADMSAGSSQMRAEYEYAALAESRAQEMYRSGRAQSLEEARAMANQSINMEWADAARREAETAQRQKFEKDLAKSIDRNQ